MNSKPESGKSCFLFISYARKDINPVKKIKRELAKRGFSIWFDEDSIIGGRKWEEEIYDAIDNCSALILMQSPSSVSSEWVDIEWRRAKSKNKPIIPALVYAFDPAENPVPEIQWINFTQYKNEDKFLYATYDLAQAICTNADYPDCKNILENIEKGLGPARIGGYLDEIHQHTAATEKWLNEIDASCKVSSNEWKEDDQKIVANRLAQLAIGNDIKDEQIVLHAAKTIGNCGNRTALSELVSYLKDNQNTGRVLDAFATIWGTRANGIPSRLLGDAKWRIRWGIAWRQLSVPPVFTVPLYTIAAACLGLMFLLYIEHSSSSTFPLRQLREAFGNGIAYGLFIGTGISLSFFLIPRIKILRQLRFIIATLSGWLIISMTFMMFTILYYGRSLFDWATWINILSLSFLFAAGYAISAVIQPKNLLTTFLRIIPVFVGVFAASYIPCLFGWSPLPSRLFWLSENCLQKAFVLSAIFTFIPFIPEITDYFSQRGSKFQLFRLHCRKLFNNLIGAK